MEETQGATKSGAPNGIFLESQLNPAPIGRMPLLPPVMALQTKIGQDGRTVKVQSAGNPALVASPAGPP
jgi:hypothetical protein